MPVLPSTAADAGKLRVLQRRRGGRLVQRGVGGAAACRPPARAVDLELPQAVAVLGGPGGAVHPDVAAGAGDVQGLGAAGAGGGGVDRGPVRAVGGRLDLERRRVRRLPLQHHLADRRGRAEVHLEPLRVAERAGPAGAGVAVHGGGRGERRVLHRRRGGGLALRQQGGGLGAVRRAGQQRRRQGERRGQGDQDAGAGTPPRLGMREKPHACPFGEAGLSGSGPRGSGLCGEREPGATSPGRARWSR